MGAFNNCTIALLEDGSLYGCGRANVLGLGSSSQIKTSFTKMTDLANVKQISCGDGFTAILLEDGTLYTCGSNGYGQLGLGSTTDITSFANVSSISNVKQISCGYNNIIALLEDGTIYGSGDNSYGQLGLGSTSRVSTFTKIDLENVKQISSGDRCSIALLEDGTIYSTGFNNSGQLGLGDTTNRKTFEKVTDMSNVKQVCCGGSAWFNAVLLEDGSLYTCGYNNYGQLGFGDTSTRYTFTKVTDLSNVKQVCCGDSFTAILLEDGTIYSTGNNGDGQLGLGDNITRTSFEKASDISNVIQIACGLNHTVALLEDGTIYSCGDNGSFQLGLGDYTDRYTFTKVTSISNVKQIEGILVSETTKFILKSNNKYYSFLESNYDTTNKVYKEITLSDDIKNDLSTYGSGLNSLLAEVTIDGETFKPVDKFESISIVGNKNINIIVTGLKANSYMLTTLEPISMKEFATINSITGDYTIENNGDIRFIFSFDKGTTWKTYDVDNNIWNDVSVTIPIKVYDNFDSTDKTNWENSKTTILSDGITIQNLGNVDFKSEKTDNLMFAVVLNRPTYNDNAVLKGLNINYDGLPTYVQLAVGSNLTNYEAMVSISGNTVSVTTASDYDSILVTMATNA